MKIPAGWAAYARAGRLFVKKVAAVTCPGGGEINYPDLGCQFETFTNGDMLELEFARPPAKAGAGAGAQTEHVEQWYLFDGVPMPTCDADVAKNVLPKVASIRG